MSTLSFQQFRVPHFQTKYSKGSVFQSNDQRKFEIGYYAYFAHIESDMKRLKNRRPMLTFCHSLHSLFFE